MWNEFYLFTGGDASAMMTAQLEAMMAQENREIFDEIKKVENREKIINKNSEDKSASHDLTFDNDDENKME